MPDEQIAKGQTISFRHQTILKEIYFFCLLCVVTLENFNVKVEKEGLEK